MQGILKPIQDFIATSEGRWACVAVVAALAFFLVLKTMLRRWRSRKNDQSDHELLEHLATYPPAPPLSAGNKALLLYGLSARVRLIVIAPLGLDAGNIHEHEIEQVLNRMVPGLSDRLQADLPRVRLWPMQLSHTGFVAAFRRNTQLPDSEDRTKRWVLVVGKVLRDGSPIAVGLALQSNEENTLGPVVLQHAHQWMEVMRFERS